MKILLTGEMNVGKSTIIEKAIKDKNIKLQGFLTYQGPFFNNSYDTYIRDINKENTYSYQFRIVKREMGKSFFYPNVFDDTGMEILNNLEISEEYLTVFDEIGVIESTTSAFRYKLLELLNAPINFIGVIKEKDHPFLNEIRQLDFIDFYKITLHNRNEIYELINQKL